MASLADIYTQITEADMQKQADVAAQNGYVVYNENTMEKAAKYDLIGRHLAHQVFEAEQADPELAKQAMGGLPPAFAAAAAAKAGDKDKDKDKEKSESKDGDKDEDEDEKKKKYAERMASMEEKKAAVLDGMANDDEYLNYILEKYTTVEEA